MNRIIDKLSKGTTPSERYLIKLCKKTFLSLWSFPNVYRDQRINKNSKEGKELCDLLVICGNDIILFSDKYCSFPDTGNIHLDWKRWYKRTIKQSAKQLFGAERWLLQHPDRIFLDSCCSTPLPLTLPKADKIQLHRIVVARGSKNRCREHLGGSGSHIIYPSIIGNDHLNSDHPEYGPFRIGQIDSKHGYVHVVDEITLDCLLNELDTVTDLLMYLKHKEQFIVSGKLRVAMGEENMLGYYLSKMDDNGEHVLYMPTKFKNLELEDGIWLNHSNSDDYHNKKQADKISYIWDNIIEEFTGHTLSDTIKGTHTDINQIERALRIMAKEKRFNRRILSDALNGLHEQSNDGSTVFRTILPNENNIAYVFMFMPIKISDVDLYRKTRNIYLDTYCYLTGYKNRNRRIILGIASEPKSQFNKSYDLIPFQNPEEWTKEMIDEATKRQELTGLLRNENINKYDIYEDEYPNHSQVLPDDVVNKIEHNSTNKANRIKRNDPCPCGSGVKYKKCCGKY